MAFLDTLSTLRGGELQVIPQDKVGLPDLAPAFAVLRPTRHRTVAGLPPMLDAALAAGGHSRPDIPVRLERFTAPPASSDLSGDQGFEVKLARSNVSVTLPPGVSILEAVRAEVPGGMSSCETAVLAGVPDHRDSVLTPRERAANDYMMICVSRALTPRLVLDL